MNNGHRSSRWGSWNHRENRTPTGGQTEAEKEGEISWISQSSLLGFQPMYSIGKLSKSNMYPADVRVWDIYLTADKLPRRQDRIRKRHKIVQRPIGSRNGTYTRVSARAGQRGSIQALINCGVKEGNEQWISHTSISEWTKQEEKKGRKEGKKKDERKEEKTERREGKGM